MTDQTRDADRDIADALEDLYDMVREQADAEHEDSRRGGILKTMRTLLERPRRAAGLLTSSQESGERAL
jgi:hypothetical protein